MPSTRRVAVVAYTEYASDGRVRKEAETLASEGFEISVIVVGKEGTEDAPLPPRIRVYRLPIQIRRGGYLRYAFQYTLFFLLSSFMLLRLQAKNGFNLVHIHSLPDFEVFSALPLKVLGVPIILDLHEAMPEIVAARFGVGPDSVGFRVATLLERASCWFADRVIAANDGIRDAVTMRGTPGSRVVSIYNSPDPLGEIPAQADLRKTYGLPASPLLVHAGGINPERDVGTLLRAVSQLPDHFACGVVLVGQGEPAYLSELKQLSQSLGLGGRVWFLGRLPLDKARAISSLSQVGVVTLASNPLTRLAWPTRIPEFVALGKRLVLPDLPFLRRMMGDSARYYTPGDPQSLARELEGAMEEADVGPNLSGGAARAVAALDWQSMRRSFLDVCDQVTGVP